MSKSDYAFPDKLALYEKLIALHPEIERKGKTMPYTSLNGHMFSFLNKEGNMGLRLGKEDREKFLAEYQTEPVVEYGSVMKEYVKVPDQLLEDTERLSGFLQKSYDYVASLKPKATKK